ncbi:MAG TPA: hypothetical protein VJ862_15250, partial [Rhodanobacteraceae bacterium]|nr:hypothetical protein [Rhodanobacteraceae bacterium]
MWFIGLLIGMLLGSVFRFGEGTIWGGMLGALVGAAISFSRGQSRSSDIETRLAALEAAVRELRQRSATPASAAAAPPEPDTPLEPAFDVAQPRQEEISFLAAQTVDPGPEAEAPAPEPAYVPVPSLPGEPSFFGRAWAWFSGGNALVRVGVVVLFFGVAFL